MNNARSLFMEDICFWSIGDGKFSVMMQGLVHSFRRVGMNNPFIAFSDKVVEGAETRLIDSFDKQCHLFKFHFLKMLLDEPYSAFVFLDADTLFLRKPPPLLPLLEKSPVHAFLECDCSKATLRKAWWGCQLDEYIQLMRDCGVITQKIYNLNAGFFIVERRAINMVCDLAEDFWRYALSKGYAFTEEPCLSYAVHILSQDPESHLLVKHFSIWASDWTGQFTEKLPDGKPWVFKDWMQGQEFLINPAIVHALKSKNLLIEYGSKLACFDTDAIRHHLN